MAIFAGVNLWTHSRTGVVSSTATTTAFSNEPTGIAWDPGRRAALDHRRRPGTDLRDRVRTGRRLGHRGRHPHRASPATPPPAATTSRTSTYNTLDGHLYVASGSSQRGLRDRPRAERRVQRRRCRPATTSSPRSASSAYGILDPEGIVYDPFWNTLVLADREHPRPLRGDARGRLPAQDRRELPRRHQALGRDDRAGLHEPAAAQLLGDRPRAWTTTATRSRTTAASTRWSRSRSAATAPRSWTPGRRRPSSGRRTA